MIKALHLFHLRGTYELRYAFTKENDGTGGGQKNGKLLLYYGGKYYLSKMVNGENYGCAALAVRVSIIHLTVIEERLCTVA